MFFIFLFWGLYYCTVIIMKTITSEFLRACTCPTQAHLSNTTLVRRGNDIPAHWFYRCPGAKFSHRRNNATIYNVISSYRDVFKRFLFRYIDRDDWYVCVTKYDFFLKLVSAQGWSISSVTLVTKIFFTVWVLNCKTFRYLVLVRKNKPKSTINTKRQKRCYSNS